MATVFFTERQTKHVKALLDRFLSRASVSKAPPPEFKLALQVCRDMIDMQYSFTPQELMLVGFVLELYFTAFDEDDVDPLAEQAYCKIAGHYPDFPEPWYDRIITHADTVGYSADRKYQRDYPLGY